MKKPYILLALLFAFLIQSCVSSKQYENLEHKLESQRDELNDAQKREESLVLFADSLSETIQNYSDIEQEKINLQNEIDSLIVGSEEKDLAFKQLMVKHSREMRNIQPEVIVVVEQKTDTVNLTSHEISSGKVAFYCPREMYHEQTYDTYGLIADVLSNQEIKSLVIQSIKEHTRDTAGIDFQDDNFLIKAIQFYEIIELRLDNVTNKGFDIVQIHDDNKQIVSDKMEGWHWKVTPITTKPQQQLFLKVIVYDENGEPYPPLKKTYHLDVKIRSGTFFHNTKILFSQNPEWAFGSFILPFLTFLFGRYKKRKENIV